MSHRPPFCSLLVLLIRAVLHTLTAQPSLARWPQGCRSSRSSYHTSTLSEGLCLHVSGTLQCRSFVPTLQM